MKPLSTSIYTFEKLRDEGFLYVDKTAMIYDLVAKTQQYFLSRPRRFGKSLLVSTLKAIFQGRRDLFEGLALADTDYDWQTYPVIHLDMGSIRSRSKEELESGLLLLVQQCAEDHDCSVSADNCYDAFTELIRNLTAGGGKVVILVDEYDKALLAHIGQESARSVQEVLKSFYAIIKTTEKNQRFVLITGVSKFSKVSIFSDLNNLTDLTMDRRAATLLGYTQEEVEANFPDYIERLAASKGMNADKTLANLRLWYNGYKFHQDAPSVYNPVSRLAIPTTKIHSPSATGWCAPWPACPTPNSAFEFKLNGSADDAMAQIQDKQYAAGYRDDPRQVILVGVAFDREDRNLGAWRIEPATAF